MQPPMLSGRTRPSCFLLPFLLVTAAGCGGGGGSGSGSPTVSSGKPGLLLELDELVPALPSITNPGDTTRFAVLLDARSGQPRTRFEWFVNDAPMDPSTGDNEELILDTSALEPGTHSVSAIASQGSRKAVLSWQLQVPPSPMANRPPVVVQAIPPGDFEMVRGWLARFQVVAADVDSQDALAYRWSLDGRTIDVDSPFLDIPDLLAGSHAVRVVVSDGAAETSHSWTVKVVDRSAEARPYIAAAWPAGSPRLERQGRLRFEVDVETFGAEIPPCLWEIDGVEVPASGPVYHFDPTASESDFSGAHRITCTLASVASDGYADSSTMAWTVILEPPLSLSATDHSNTPPQPGATTPGYDVRVLPGECYVFRANAFDVDGDALTFAWFVDGVRQVASGPVFTYRAGEEVREGSVTVELRAADGHEGQGSPSDYRLGLWTLSLADVDTRGLSLATGAIVIDNGQAGTVPSGYWPVSGASSPYGASSLYSKAVGKYSYQSALAAGKYEVLLWWTVWPGRSTAVPVAIQHATGTANATVNQTINGGRWNPIGTYEFGTSGKITITSVGSTTSTCADAVCFNPVSASTTSNEFVIDDGTAGTSYEGAWGVSSAPSPYGTRSLYSNVAGNRYNFARTISASATYDVYAWWTEWPSRERQVPYEISHQGGVAVVVKDQLSAGGRWNLLGRYSFGTAVKVSVRVPGTASVCADAVRFVKVTSGSPAPATTYSVALTWSPPTKNTDGTILQDLVGYKLYWGTKSRQYTQTMDVKTASATLSQLPAGTYYFAVTAYDKLGNQSPYSGEVTATRP